MQNNHLLAETYSEVDRTGSESYLVGTVFFCGDDFGTKSRNCNFRGVESKGENIGFCVKIVNFVRQNGFKKKTYMFELKNDFIFYFLCEKIKVDECKFGFCESEEIQKLKSR